MSVIGYEDDLRKWIYLTAKDYEYNEDLINERGKRKFGIEGMYEAMENFVDAYAREWERIYNLPGISEKEKDKMWKYYMIDTPGAMHGAKSLGSKSQMMKELKKMVGKKTKTKNRISSTPRPRRKFKITK